MRVDAGTVDLASVLHQRVERWTDVSGTSAAPGHRFVLGLLPAAATENPEMAAALQDRVRLMEQRADELIDRARTANAPWLAQLGREPENPAEHAAWLARARTVVAYRERHQITDPWGPLGDPESGTQQQRREATLAARAITDLRPEQPPAARRSTAESTVAPRYSDAIGR